MPVRDAGVEPSVREREHRPSGAGVDAGGGLRSQVREVDHAADDLAASGLGVQDAPGRDRIDDAGDTDDTELLVYHDFREYRRMRVVGM